MLSDSSLQEEKEEQKGKMVGRKQEGNIPQTIHSLLLQNLLRNLRKRLPAAHGSSQLAKQNT